MVIDSHQHFWQRNNPFDYRWLDNPGMAAINQDYGPKDLYPQICELGIDKTVFVQTQHDVAENRWALSLAEQFDFIVGVVGWVDLASNECESQLVEFKEHEKFVGVRHVTQDEPDDNFIVGPDVVRGLKVLEKHGVPFDLLFYTKHLRHAPTLAQQLPNLPMVIDHLSKPEIRLGKHESWAADLRAAAEYENVFCKLSGLITEADWENWQPADLKPYIDTALECFSPQRCMFGSDWPVCELAGSYRQVYEALNEALGPISETERNAIFGETAASFYGLKQSGC